MKLKKTFLVILLIQYIVFSIYASNTDSIKIANKYLTLGTGFMITSVKDELNTSLPYSGNNFAFTLDYIWQNNKKYFSVSNTFSTGELSPYDAPGGYNNTQSSVVDKFNIQLLWLTYSCQQQKLLFYIGPDVKAQVGARFTNANVGNSGITYEGSLAGQIATRIERYFSIFNKNSHDNNFCFSFTFSYPLIAKVWSPPYIGLPEKLLQEKASVVDLSSNYNSVLTKFINPELNFSLRYVMKNKNSVGITYSHNYISSSPKYNKAKVLNQFFGINLFVNLK